MRLFCRAIGLLVVLSSALAGRAAADVLPSQPITLLDGRLVIGGEGSVSVSPSDPGYFNFTDYNHNALRLVRLGVTAALSAGRHVTVLTEIRTENWDALRPYALYVRVRPWTRHAFDIQAGRIPPVFGAFSRRPYDADNPLVGTPLAYQYLTSLRADALPASADDLLRMRGRGWYASYPIGSSDGGHGLPLVTAFRWDTGIEVSVGDRMQPVSLSVAVTNGTLSNPLVGDDNAGKQLSGRVEWRPVPGLIVGASGARGPFVARAASNALPAGVPRDGLTQTAFGVDAEYSSGYWLVRGEAIVSRWRVPPVSAPFITSPLQAVSAFVEGRYTILPGVYLAGRVDHLGFSTITGSAGPETWDAPVTRFEVGGGYSLQRNVLLKLAFQHDSRDTVRVPTASLAVAQLSFWF
ncbi:MAG: hypothetical protein KGN76_14465 [Acidobacteriota bacterium]|nr:hypothetical protein [Acidobacteriota bacterium]